MERAELDRDARANAQEGGEGALVEGERAFVGPDGFGGREGGALGRGAGLEADFDDVEGLAWREGGMEVSNGTCLGWVGTWY